MRIGLDRAEKMGIFESSGVNGHCFRPFPTSVWGGSRSLVTPKPGMSDSAGGSHPSIEDLVAAYHSDVYRSALYLTGSTADAEDLTQQTFLQALQKLCQLRDPRSVKSWLLTILRNSFLNEKRRTREIPWEDCEVATEPDIETGSPGMLEMEVTPQDVLNAVRTLDEHHRVVVTMFYLERRSYQDIADELGIKLGTVMSRLSRAKRQLRLRLSHKDQS